MFDLGEDIYSLLDINGWELTEWGEIPGGYGAYWFISTESGFDDSMIYVPIKCLDDSPKEFIKGVARAVDNLDAQDLVAKWTFRSDKDIDELMEYANSICGRLNDLMNDLLDLDIVMVEEM